MARREFEGRVHRTRTWILQAFKELVFQRPYAGVSAEQIVKRAGVGRSTFYEHFRGKDEVLLAAVSEILSALADAATNAGDERRIRNVADHLMDQREMALPMLNGPTGETIAGELARLVEERLCAGEDREGVRFVVPVALVARQVAAAQVELLRGWLEDGACSSARDVAAAICRGSRGLAAALECGVVVGR